MTDKSFTTTITVDQTPEEVFAAINNVGGWWFGHIEGETTNQGDQFTYRFKEFHSSTQKITESVPGKKVVWHVVDSQLNFVKDKTEWTGTDIIFDIAKKGDKTELRFTHEGLEPAFECYEGCAGAWSGIVSSNLRKLIAGGNA